MSMTRLLLLAVPLTILAACSSPVSPATDCVYDKTAAAAPGNQLCTPSPTIQSDVTQ
jgi:hypothetical protein